MIDNLIIKSTELLKEANNLIEKDRSLISNESELKYKLESEVNRLKTLLEENNYKIKYISDSLAIIFSVSYISPTSQMTRITDELNKNNFNGVIIFDCLLNNGLGSQRLFEVIFDSKFNDINHISEELLNKVNSILNQFYIDNNQLLENSILSDIDILSIKENKFISLED